MRGLTIDGHIPGDKLAEPIDLTMDRASVYAVLHWIFLKRDLSWAVRGRDVLVGPLSFMDPDVVARQNRFVEATEDAWEAAVRPKFLATKLSIDVSGVPAEGVARIVAERVGVGVVWAPGAEKSRTCPGEFKLEKATLGEILDKLAATLGVEMGLEAEAIVFSPAKP